MRDTFDRRVVPEAVLDFVRECQARTPCRLAGGATLAGVYLGHRMTGDIDLFCQTTEDVRSLVTQLPEIARSTGGTTAILRDAGHLVRAELTLPDGESIEIDLVHEPAAEIEPPPAPVEGVLIHSLADLRASKLTCILSRSEPRDLVDLCFLDRAGFPPDQDLDIALQKDAGIDPGILSWLLTQFPTRPMPQMLVPLSEENLREFRADLAARMRQVAKF